MIDKEEQEDVASLKRHRTSTFGPWAMITEASTGIGEEFARQLAVLPHSVVDNSTSSSEGISSSFFSLSTGSGG
jgi:hypothetical protein